MHIFTFTTKYIVVLFTLCCFSAFSQEKEEKNEQTVKNDSLNFKQKYGIRVGADLSKLVRSFIDESYKGFEVNGDLRITKRWYLAAEIGSEEKQAQTNFINNTASGNYFKIGGDYNMYQNWLDMENLIYFAPRIGFSSFSQTLNSYSVFISNKYWESQFTSNTPVKYDGLSAVWAEIGFGIKAEIFNNLFVGLNVQLKRMIKQKQPDNYQNLYVPGFNKTYESSRFGAGYGYTISYLIPILKKNKHTSKKETENEDKKDNN